MKASTSSITQNKVDPPAVLTLDELEKRWFQPMHGRRQIVVLFAYYLAILIALLLIYGQGDFVTAPFVYQGF